MKRMATNMLIALIIIPLLGSCGKPESTAKGKQQPQDNPDDPTGAIDGLLMAKFETLNPHINGTIPGSLTLSMKDDKLITFLRVFAGQPKAWHPQGIYMGSRCPNLGDDKNGDGIIDIVEAMNVVGKMIVPLDTNMNSQMSGKNFFPIGDLSGYYHYERVASYSRLVEDLRGVDSDTEDHITKLTADEPFSFENRTVIVQGVLEETILPETVSGLGKRRPFQTLPITCGVIKKVATTPGTPDTGVIPGPVADVIEGQDQPAPAGDDTGAGGGTVAGTPGTNDNEDGEVGDEGGTEGGGTTVGGSTGGTTGGTTGGETGGTTGRSTGGFIGGFIGGSSGGRTGGTSGGGTTGRSTGGFIGGFIGGSSGGSSTGGSTTTTGGSSGR